MTKKLVIEIINFYQKFLSFDTGLLRILAPGGTCIYAVSCSEYTKLMIMEVGVVRGIGMGFKRIISCNRWGLSWS